MIMLDILAYYSLICFFAYYIINHSSFLEAVRVCIMPKLPIWLAKSLTCAFCFTFWVLMAFSLFTGWTPLPVVCAPVVLGMDLAYRKLQSS